MNLSVAHLPVSESCYHILVRSDHGSCEGELTRDPREGPGGLRSLLRVDRNDFSRLLGPISWPHELRGLVEATQRDSGFGSIRSAKGRVLEIGAQPDPRLAVAVHHFGPVPLVMVPNSSIGRAPEEPLTIEVNNMPLTLRLGIYPNFGVHATRERNKNSSSGNGPGSVAECLKSYELGLDAMLLKYMEDVAEDLYDIEHHLTLRRALRRARKTEETLSGSVREKLDQIRTHLLDSRSPLHSIAQRLLERYGDWIVLASHARIYVLTMLNQFYALNDIKSKTKYKDDWNEVQARARKWLNGRYSDLIEGPGDLGRLVRSYAAHGAGSLSGLDELSAGGSLWVSKLVSFTRYLTGLKLDNLRPAAARVFFSGRHNSPETGSLFRDMMSHFANGPSSKRPVEVVYVAATPPGDVIDWTIKRRISASHAIVAAITIEDQGRLDYIIKESEHATRRDETFPFRPLVEEGVDLAALQNEFGTYSDYFPPTDSRVQIAERQRFLRDKVSRVGLSRFRDSDGWIISPDLERKLNQVADTARERFVFDKVHGLLQFFVYEHRRVLRFAMKHAGKQSRTKRWLTERIASDMQESLQRARSLVNGAWDAQKKRALEFDGAQYTLLTMPQTGRFQSNLRSIVHRLWPELGDGDALDDLVTRVVDGIG
jgi:hypothetical protein